ncbi:MAG: HAD-IG family 5'-nucleotidase [Hyphomonadaceae bacterium]|nr:HAD-IG family 5'-nucleotidase [Hyphomonadaceae bacterium]
MYTTMVDWADRQTGTVAYDKLFNDIRTAIDEAHRDDTLKSVIKADLPSFTHRKDPPARGSGAGSAAFQTA